MAHLHAALALDTALVKDSVNKENPQPQPQPTTTTTTTTMDNLREKVAEAIKPGFPIVPPARIGFKVGDILLVNRDQNPALDCIHDRWFSAANQNISTFLPAFTPPQLPPPDSAWLSMGETIEDKEVIKLFIGCPTFTDARNTLKGIFHDEGQMAGVLQAPQNRDSWIEDFCC